ncbi:MAG: DUF4366 domain-containing protein [Defluviitaleaceae bacterium]|nr:DUF4366 domain-containing protein [Defluviitaleaceae bacterium]
MTKWLRALPILSILIFTMVFSPLIVFGDEVDDAPSYNIHTYQNGRNAINHTPLNILSITPVSDLEVGAGGQSASSQTVAPQAPVTTSPPEPEEINISGLPDEPPPDWFFDLFGINVDVLSLYQEDAAPEMPPEPLPDLLETNGQVILPSPSSLTPSGGGELVDSIMVGDMEFITINSQAGNVFFLIIDRSREENNVYFLAPVTEFYLMSLAGQVDEYASIQRGGMPSGFTGGFHQAQNQTAAPSEAEGGGRRAGMSPVALFAILAMMGAIFFFYARSRKKKSAANLESFGTNDDEYAEDFLIEDGNDEFTQESDHIMAEVSDPDFQSLESADNAFDDSPAEFAYDTHDHEGR